MLSRILRKESRIEDLLHSIGVGTQKAAGTSSSYPNTRVVSGVVMSNSRLTDSRCPLRDVGQIGYRRFDIDIVC